MFTGSAVVLILHHIHVHVAPFRLFNCLFIVVQCVRNVLNVDFHVVKYKNIVQELQKEVSQPSVDDTTNASLAPRLSSSQSLLAVHRGLQVTKSWIRAWERGYIL